MFPTTSRAPRTPFTHEEVLKVCNFYRNLLLHLRGVQGAIDEAIDKFTHSQYGRPSEPLTRLLTDLATIDAKIRNPLLDEIMQVEITAIKWETKSAKLRSEANRQRRKRQRRRDGEERTSHAAQLEDEFGPFGDDADDSDEVGASNASDGEDFYNPPSLPGPSVISPTMALAQRGMSQLPEKPSSNVPTNESYKKSGLV